MRILFSIGCLALIATTARAEVPADLTAASRKAGQEILANLQEDLDGDGTKEWLLALKVEYGTVLTLWNRPDPEQPYKMVFKGQRFDGEVVMLCEARQLVGSPEPEILFEMREETPDETSRRFAIYQYRDRELKPIFEGTFPVGPMRKASGEQVLAFGETAPGYRLIDDDGDGQQEIAVRRDLKVLNAKLKGKSPLRVVVGAKESIYRFESGHGKYVLEGDRFHAYLDEVQATSFGGSSQVLPKHLQSKFDRAAVEQGVDGVFADDAKEDLSMTTDPAPMAKWAGDGDMATSWCEGAKGTGEDEWWQVNFAGPANLRMAKLVFGDVRSKRAFFRRNEVIEASLVFEGGDRILFNREKPDLSIGDLSGFSDNRIDKKTPGKQTIIFFSRPITTSWARIQLGKARKRGSANETCITEAVFYSQRTD